VSPIRSPINPATSVSINARICGELDTVVAAFRTRPLTGEHRYLWVDVTPTATTVAWLITRPSTRTLWRPAWSAADLTLNFKERFGLSEEVRLDILASILAENDSVQGPSR
jgi:hypothetical protein